MKYSFSTIGCPSWLWKEIVATAKDLGYDGIELRAVANKTYLPSTRTFSIEHCPAIRLQLGDLGLSIPCLSSSALLYHKDLQEAAQAEMRDYINMAALLDAPYVRVFADREAAPGKGVDEGVIVENLREISGFAQDKDVMLLVETNGIYGDSTRLAGLMDRVNNPNVGVLWDIHHPFRYYGEMPADTHRRLKDWIRHIHVKDSLMENGRPVYKMIGYGDVPLREAIAVLMGAGYTGFIALEWMKQWVDDLEDPGIVFAQFPYAIKRMIRAIGQ